MKQDLLAGFQYVYLAFFCGLCKCVCNYLLHRKTVLY